mmetsp:Transcript_412/g.798  ORF Transcript_412/g.798 Transcript_412/m.798 type:complete len:128 (-) Transcript_412:38-421(-)
MTICRAKLKFRNYQPKTEELAEAVVEKSQVATLPDVETTTKKRAADSEEQAEEEADQAQDDIDVLSVAPKKANWDLKRDVEKKLQVLERRTQRAIIELTREKVLREQGEDGGEALATAVASAAPKKR